MRLIELTDMYLARLHRYQPKLNFVVTFLDDLARQQAKQADSEIAKPSTARESAVVKQWAPTITAMIVASQNLRVAAAMDEDNMQVRLSSLQNLKHFVWIMSEYLGRERAYVEVAGHELAAAAPFRKAPIADLSD